MIDWGFLVDEAYEQKDLTEENVNKNE